jgi:hypothetical protein
MKNHETSDVMICACSSNGRSLFTSADNVYIFRQNVISSRWNMTTCFGTLVPSPGSIFIYNYCVM